MQNASLRTYELEMSPSYQLWRATNAWQRCVRKTLEPLGVTFTQQVLLGSIQFLQDNGEVVTQVKLARFADMDENMVSQILRTLEKRNYVKRRTDPNDRRAHQLVLTEKGVQMCTEGIAAVAEQRERFFAILGEDRSAFTEKMKMLADSSKRPD